MSLVSQIFTYVTTSVGNAFNSLLTDSDSDMISLSGPIAKRSRLSLKNSKPSPSTKTDSKSNIFSPQVFGQNDSSQFKQSSTENAPSEIDGTVPKYKAFNIQDENMSPNVTLIKLELKPSLQAMLPPKLEKPEPVDIETSVLGLPNCGNTCYVNSVLQVLRYTPCFLFSLHKLMAMQDYRKMHFPTEFLADSESYFFYHLHELYVSMKKQETLVKENPAEKFNYDELLNPVEAFIKSLRVISSQFREDEQQDAHEFLLSLISSFSLSAEKCKRNTNSSSDLSKSESEISIISEESATPLKPVRRVRAKGRARKRLRQVRKDENSNIVLSYLKRDDVSFNESIADDNCMQSLNMLFEGKLCHIVQCLECEVKQEREEIFSDIKVHISRENSSNCEPVLLLDCLSQHTYLKGDNKYYCENCVHLNEAKLSSEVVEPPRILLLHISWLSEFSDITEVEKSCTRIMIPLSLETATNCELFSRLPEQHYKLYAIILHIGSSALGGHYVSFINISSFENVRNETSSATDIFLEEEIKICCQMRESNVGSENSSWYLFDDESVTPVDVKEMDNSFPYFNYFGTTATPFMLFYQRK